MVTWSSRPSYTLGWPSIWWSRLCRATIVALYRIHHWLFLHLPITLFNKAVTKQIFSYSVFLTYSKVIQLLKKFTAVINSTGEWSTNESYPETFQEYFSKKSLSFWDVTPCSLVGNMQGQILTWRGEGSYMVRMLVLKHCTYPWNYNW
jgi:hypothetical protein